MTKESTIELQKIDCNCNDCKHLIRHVQQAQTQKGKQSPIYEGCCAMHKKTVTFIPNTCQLHTQQCFEHRKSNPANADKPKL